MFSVDANNDLSPLTPDGETSDIKSSSFTKGVSITFGESFNFSPIGSVTFSCKKIFSYI